MAELMRSAKMIGLAGALDDAALLNALRDQSWDLRCFNVPTGGDDYVRRIAMLMIQPLTILSIWMTVWCGIAVIVGNIWWLKYGALLIAVLPVAIGIIGAVGAAIYAISPAGRRQRKREDAERAVIDERHNRLRALIEETKLLYPKRPG